MESNKNRSPDIESSEIQRPVVYNKSNGTEFVCEVEGCNFRIGLRKNWDRHLYSHTKIKTYVCLEKGCGRSYVTNSHLGRHRREAHLRIKISCSHPDCPRTFTSRSTMIRHKKCNHPECPEESPFPLHSCDECGQTFSRKDRFLEHYTTHTGKLPYVCDICPANFKCRQSLKHHKEAHDKNIECIICSLVFQSKDEHNMHKRQVHQFICRECGREFVRFRHYKKHMDDHLKPETVFLCEYADCSKSFSRKRNLLAHFRAQHTWNGKFECDFCGKRMTHKVKLKLHLDRHMRYPDRMLSRRTQNSRKNQDIRRKRPFESNEFLTINDFSRHLKHVNKDKVCFNIETLPEKLECSVSMEDSMMIKSSSITVKLEQFEVEPTIDESIIDDKSHVLMRLPPDEANRLIQQWEDYKARPVDSSFGMLNDSNNSHK